jgi:hypothetical protein
VQVRLDHRQTAGSVGLAGEDVRPGVHDPGQVAVADLPAPDDSRRTSRTLDALDGPSASLPPQCVDAASRHEAHQVDLSDAT